MGIPKSAVLLIILAALAGGMEAQQVTLKIGEWAPFTGEKLPAMGMAAEIVSKAMAHAGLEPLYSFVPWKRAEADVSIGAAFGTFPYLIIQERKEDFFFSEPLFVSRFAAVFSGDFPPDPDAAFRKAEDLQGYTVGIVAGTNAVKFPLAAAGVRVVEFQSPEQLMAMLEGNRIRCAIDDRAVIEETAKKFPDTVFILRDIPFFGENAYRLMVSKRYPGAPGMLERFNRGRAVMVENGTLREILGRFGLQ